MKSLHFTCKILVLFLLLFLPACAGKQKKVFAKKMPNWTRDQITEDLSPFKRWHYSYEALSDLMDEKGKDWLLARFTIVNQTLRVTCPVEREDALLRLHALKKIFTKLCTKVTLPDVDFIVTLHDNLDDQELVVPIFAFAKKSTSKTVLMPDFEVLTVGSNLRSQAKAASKQFPWNKKINKAIWRGATTGGIFHHDNFLDFPRTKACSISLNHPDLVDAKFSDLVQCSEQEQVLQTYSKYFGESLSISEQIQYKYQLLIDGNSCSYARAYWQFFSNCAVIKQSSPNIQWYYRLLRPYVHYIPVHDDLSDLKDILIWCTTHDAETQKITKQAQKLAHEHINHTGMLQYIYFLLQEYAKIQNPPI